MIRPARTALAAGLLVLLLAGPSEPTSVKRLTEAELVSEAETIVHADCVQTRAEWDERGRRIDTVVTLSARETLKGRAAATLTLRVPGGERDGRAYVIHGMPRFRPGLETVVFLTAAHPKSGVSVPVGLGQGLWEVNRGRGAPAVARRDMRELTLVQVRPGARPALERGAVQVRALDDLLSQVRGEVQRQRAERERARRPR